MKIQRKIFIRYFAILLSLIFLLQGCVSPKTGQLSIPLPKDISYPSALVIKDKYLGVLSMEGKFDPLYKVNGNLVNNPKKMVDVQNKKSVNFLIKSKSFIFPTYSFWDMDLSTRRLNCLIPSLRNVSNLKGFELTPDKNYFQYSEVYFEKDLTFRRPFQLYYEGIFQNRKLYSINQQQLVKIPEIKGLNFYYFLIGLIPEMCFLVYYKKMSTKEYTQVLYLWDLKNNTLKQILFPGLELPHQFSG
jgi:hypothetical protein